MSQFSFAVTKYQHKTKGRKIYFGLWVQGFQSMTVCGPIALDLWQGRTSGRGACGETKAAHLMAAGKHRACFYNKAPPSEPVKL